MQQELITDQVFYHFQNYKNDLWQEGNEFIVDNRFKSFGTFTFEHTPVYKINDKKITDLMDDANEGKLNREELLELKEKTKACILDTKLNQRELILDVIREMFYKDLISRGNCLFLTDQDSLEFWKRQFVNTNPDLYQVLVTGKIFQSYNCLLPDKYASIENQVKQAHAYWKRNIDLYTKFHEHNYSDKEYLFQGHVKVLKKI